MWSEHRTAVDEVRLDDLGATDDLAREPVVVGVDHEVEQPVEEQYLVRYLGSSHDCSQWPGWIVQNLIGILYFIFYEKAKPFGPFIKISSNLGRGGMCPVSSTKSIIYIHIP